MSTESSVECVVCGKLFHSEHAKNIHKTKLHEGNNPWDDEQRLEREYIQKNKSSKELADEWGCSRATISRAVRRFGLNGIKEDPIGKRVERAHFHTDESGYERCQAAVGDTTKHIKIHRLIAVAHHGISAVKDKVVHHDNDLKWDNRPCNLEIMERGEHVAMHNRKRDYK